MTDERIAKLASDILDLVSYVDVSYGEVNRCGDDTFLGDMDKQAVKLIKEFLNESIGNIEAVPHVSWADGCGDVMIGVGIEKRDAK